ncbi:MAG TPA: hypothetical protein VKP69_32035 [Isosphaeraceae bacterium]|nr:hypothetical protein [Isosphaeraceae bacterium]
MPRLARPYVRAEDLPGIDPKHRPPFRTKLERAAELLRWAKMGLGPLGEPLWMVLVDEPTGWVASFCTDVSATVADILGAVADRSSLEAAFRDCNGIVGAGQQQVRFVGADVGASPVCLWTDTMTEA